MTASIEFPHIKQVVTGFHRHFAWMVGIAAGIILLNSQQRMPANGIFLIEAAIPFILAIAASPIFRPQDSGKIIQYVGAGIIMQLPNAHGGKAWDLLRGIAGIEYFGPEQRAIRPLSGHRCKPAFLRIHPIVPFL